MSKKKFLALLGLLLAVSVAITACGGSPEVVSSGTSSGDYVSPILQTNMVGNTVGAGVILGIIALVIGLIAGAVAFFATSRATDKNSTSIILGVVAFVIVAGAIFGPGYFQNSYVNIDSGNVGVVLDQGKAVRTLEPGPHWITGYRERVVIFSTREFTFSTNSDPINRGSEAYRTWDMGITTSDGVDGSVPFQIRAKLNPAQAIAIYNEYGSLEDAIIQIIKTPALEKVRDVTRGKSAEDLITKIDTYNSEVQNVLIAAAGDKLTIISFGFRQPDMGAWQVERNAAQVALQTAIKEQNNKEVVQAQQDQRKIEAQTTAEINTINAQQAADAAVISANGAAEAKKLQADADAYAALAASQAEAEGNKMVSASLTPELIQYLQVMQWDGAYPQTWLSPDGNFIIQIPK